MDSWSLCGGQKTTRLQPTLFPWSAYHYSPQHRGSPITFVPTSMGSLQAPWGPCRPHGVSLFPDPVLASSVELPHAHRISENGSTQMHGNKLKVNSSYFGTGAALKSLQTNRIGSKNVEKPSIFLPIQLHEKLARNIKLSKNSPGKSLPSGK